MKDDKDPNEDERYSSEVSTVASTWRQFADPESDVKVILSTYTENLQVNI